MIDQVLHDSCRTIMKKEHFASAPSSYHLPLLALLFLVKIHTYEIHDKFLTVPLLCLPAPNLFLLDFLLSKSLHIFQAT